MSARGRITFLTGSAERGKDGVADYTHTLASECARRGAPCQIVALHDRHVDRIVVARPTPGVHLLRLPRQLRWSSRLRTARRAIEVWSPACVSVQFVPYSFQRWGWAHRLVRALPALAGRAGLQVMLHEIWIGGEHSWRRRVVSAGQRRCVQRLARLPGVVLQTSNTTYQQMLAQHGIDAGLLPLFGSVPFASSDASRWLFPALTDVGCGDLAQRRASWWLFAFFGTLHPVWPPEPLLARLQAVATLVDKRVALISVGRMGAGTALWDRMRTQYGARIPMLSLNDQPADRISELFNTVDFGIAASPYSLLGKSATAAAMIEHGLPLVVNREAPCSDAPDRQSPRAMALVIRLSDAGFTRRLLDTRRLAPVSGLPAVAGQFLARLESFPHRERRWSC